MAIVRNIKNDFFYRYLGQNKFLNIATGITGVVTDEAAQKTFRIRLEETELFNEFPLIEELINKLNLKNDHDVLGLSK